MYGDVGKEGTGKLGERDVTRRGEGEPHWRLPICVCRHVSVDMCSVALCWLLAKPL